MYSFDTIFRSRLIPPIDVVVKTNSVQEIKAVKKAAFEENLEVIQIRKSDDLRRNLKIKTTPIIAIDDSDVPQLKNFKEYSETYAADIKTFNEAENGTLL